MTGPTHLLVISDAAGEVFRLAPDGSVTADVARIRKAAAEGHDTDYVVLCRALTWALDQGGRGAAS